MSELGSTKETVVAPDKPNKKCNRHLKARLLRIGSTILRESKRTTRTDDLYLFARKLNDKKLPYKKAAFKVAAKVGRKVFRILRTGLQYDGDAEKLPGDAATGMQRSGTAKRRQRYQRERAARLAAECTAGALENLLRDLGVGDAKLRDIKTTGTGE